VDEHHPPPTCPEPFGAEGAAPRPEAEGRQWLRHTRDGLCCHRVVAPSSLRAGDSLVAALLGTVLVEPSLRSVMVPR